MPGVECVGAQPEQMCILSIHRTAARVAGQSEEEDALMHRSLANFGLERYANTPCARLSAGQQRRVALARLCISSHLLWILDEPFNAIDQQGVAMLEHMFEQHMARGGIVVLTTHQSPRSERLLTLDLDLHAAGFPENSEENYA